ncbi:MAG: cytochrome-c oxidase [bacterium]|nr:MAG: cytochrome-c oxidase [bacterium]
MKTHKVIGLSYIGAAVLMAFVGGSLALLFSSQLAFPEQFLLIGSEYNTSVTLHGMIMVLWVALPVLFSALGHLIIPKAIGSKKMFSSSLTVLSFGIFAISIFLFIASLIVDKYMGHSIFLSSALRGGNIADQFMELGYHIFVLSTQSPDVSTSVSMISLHLMMAAIGLNLVSQIINGIHFVLTSLVRRFKEIKILKLPVVVWVINLSSIYLIVLLVPPIVGVAMILTDLLGGISFYGPNVGGDPILFQYIGSLGFLAGYSVAHIFIALTGGILADIGLSLARPLKWQKITAYIFVLFIVVIFMLNMLFGFIESWNERTDGVDSIVYSGFYPPLHVVILFLTGLYIWNLIKRRFSLKVEVLWAFGMLASLIVTQVIGGHMRFSIDSLFFADNTTYTVVDYYPPMLILVFLFGGFAAIYHWFQEIIGRQYNKVLAYIHFVLTLIFFYGILLSRFLPLPMEPYQDTSPGTDPESINIFILAMTIGLALTQLVWVYNMIWSGWKGKLVDTET